MQNFKRKYSIWDVLDWISWFTLFGSGYVTEFQYHLYIPSLYLILRGFGRRKDIKTDLKNAVDYCRVRWSIKSIVYRTIATAPFLILWVYYYETIQLYLPSDDFLDYAYLIFTVLIYLLFLARLENFTTGIRWYVSGIKLPGERSLLIPWRHISDVKAENGYIFLTAFGKEHKFDINPDDYRSALHFVRWFEKKKNNEE